MFSHSCSFSFYAPNAFSYSGVRTYYISTYWHTLQSVWLKTQSFSTIHQLVTYIKFISIPMQCVYISYLQFRSETINNVRYDVGPSRIVLLTYCFINLFPGKCNIRI